MALTNKQKNEIYRLANSGKATGTELAKKYGVSPSVISVIKNHYTPTEATAKSTASKKAAVKNVAAKKEKVKKAKISNQETFTAIVSSNKTNAVKVVLPVGSTFGELLTMVNETGSLEGVFKNVKSSERSRVKAIADIIPAQVNDEYHVYLLPLKADSGQKC